MILSFKERFIVPILDGTKIHTIREDKNCRWKPDRLIHFATGVRTKEYLEFKQSLCVSTQKIEIECGVSNGEKQVSVEVDGRPLSVAEILRLSKADGFESILDFYKWFEGSFKGRLIHWTNFKY